MRLSNVLIARGEESEESLALFSMINLGFIESLANGILTASDAVRFFYSAENCMFVRKHVKNKIADQIMSHGVQLPDLFEALPTEEAFREFQHEWRRCDHYASRSSARKNRSPETQTTSHAYRGHERKH